jgi:glyoxylase-like metal-dependent hydrolase (beta-lactamase superfamily II)
MSLSRRTLLGAPAATAALALIPPSAAEAAAPFRNQLPPAWHRFRVGAFEATIVSDGTLSVGRPEALFPPPPPAELETLLRNSFLRHDVVTLEQNALVLNTGRQLLLFDTGMGSSMGQPVRDFAPNAGRMLANLRAAGIEPAEIDLVILTHGHPDHCWALVDAAGNRSFPNAQLAISEADLRFWTDDANKRGPDFMSFFIDGAKKNLSAYRDRMIMVRDGQELVPGVTAIAAPGHTVGHHVYAIASGNAVLMNTGDIVHHHVLLMRRPMWDMAFDTDPKLGARTRNAMLDRIATERHAMLSYHFPWPGLGHAAKEGEGYAWIPAPMNVTTLG